MRTRIVRRRECDSWTKSVFALLYTLLILWILWGTWIIKGEKLDFIFNYNLLLGIFAWILSIIIFPWIVFIATLYIHSKSFTLIEKIKSDREDLPTVRKWKNACKYPKWVGILITIVGGALAIYQSVTGGWLGVSGAVLGASSELTKKRLEKWEARLVAQQSLTANAESTSQEEIELGEVDNQEFETRIEIPSV